MTRDVPQEDRVAIEAVKKGDTERFGELVGRYHRMVYAVAWSRLGDADLCEDVAQETFIRGFRFLAALRRPERFPAWIARIARNLAVETGRRRRNELDSLRRWSLEQPASSQTPDLQSSPGERVEETLRDLLASLPPAARESLVLFYLEERSVADCAGILGVSEGAFKTRLHRARAELRGRMEERLGQSLGRLKPKGDIRRRVLAAIPAMPLGLGGGGAGIGGILSWAPAASIMLLSKIPFFLFLGWINSRMARNYREVGGFRPRAIWANLRNLVMLIITAMAGAYFAVFHWGLGALYKSLAVFMLPALISALLLLRISRSGFHLATAIGSAAMFLAFAGIGFLGLSFAWFLLAMLIYNVGHWLARRSFPARGDYNLFLRAATGGLGEVEDLKGTRETLSAPDVRAFSRFLGDRLLIQDYSRRSTGTSFYLPPVMGNVLAMLLPLPRLFSSAVHVDPGGRFRASITATDLRSLRKLNPGADFHARELESYVASIVQAAFVRFQADDMDGASRLLQAKAEEEILHQPLHRLRSQKILYGVAIAGCLIGLATWPSVEARRPRIVSREDARAALSSWIARTARDPGAPASRDLWHSLENGAFPAALDFDPAAVSALQRLALERIRQNGGPANFPESRSIFLINLLQGGWATKDDLAANGYSENEIRQAWRFLTERSKRPIAEPRWELLKDPSSACWALESFAAEAWLLREMGCGDLLDAGSIAARLVALQKDGLFIVGDGYHVFRTTHGFLSILDALGRLDAIDRKASADAIMARYRNRQRFDNGSGKPTVRPEDSYHALECLVILCETSRVKDLNRWSFQADWESWRDGKRVEPFITPQIIENWAWQLRLEEIRSKRTP